MVQFKWTCWVRTSERLARLLGSMTFVLVAAMVVYKRKKEGKKERKFCTIQNEYKPIETLSCSLSSCTRENKLLRRRGKKTHLRCIFPHRRKGELFAKMLPRFRHPHEHYYWPFASPRFSKQPVFLFLSHRYLFIMAKVCYTFEGHNIY